MTIGITGARGIIGRRFAALARDRGEAISTFSGDLRDYDSVRAWAESARPDRIVHCAARVEVPRAEADPQTAFAVNVGGTLNLVKALQTLEQPVWLFYCSSSHVYADATGPIDETHTIGPRNVYALTKHLGEQAAQYYAGPQVYARPHDGRPAWLRLCIGRVFSIYDPDQTGSYLYPATAARIATHNRADPLVIRDGRAIRDFSSATAIAATIHTLMRERTEGILNIGSGCGRTVVEQLALLFGPETRFVPDEAPTSSVIVADITKLTRVLDGAA